MCSQMKQQWDMKGFSTKERENLLGDFLCFLNTLCATHQSLRKILASGSWFNALLRVVDVDLKTGLHLVSSVKTRLLAVQVLECTMIELSDDGEIEHCAKVYFLYLILFQFYVCLFRS